ncbi:OmpA family protein [Chondrinema litorale]|uniref:OmpA family protein n=1 Tax=Chondrinema litorale TaxID=2994555 RepID=UPI002543764B|nr:OmpA family protein [Chondrinema litorale]UZR93763.1 OmpA family protein [Chondrinema litorale]
MKILLTGLLCFGLWATGTTYWYLCKIENLCLGTTSNNITAENIKVSPEESTIEKDIDSTETDILHSNDTSEIIIDSISIDPKTKVLDEAKGITQQMTFHFDFATIDIQEDLSKNESFLNLISYLKENTGKKITITGHTDNVGDEAKNLQLGQERAEKVKETLQKYEIDTHRIDAKSMGEYEPLSTNKTNEGRQNNRRVEILIKN